MNHLTNDPRPKDGWKMPRDSYTKMKTYFTDGNEGLWYSWDWKHKQSPVRDRRIGMARHHARIKKFGHQCRTALIFDTATEQLLEKYRYGKRVPIDPNETETE